MHALSFLPLLLATPSASELLNRQFPHLIIPVNAAEPNRAYSTQLTGNITQQKYTEISFDIPSNAATSCQLNFLINTFPSINAPWSLWGEPPYQFNISSLPPAINKDTDTWNSRPKPIATIATVTLSKNGSASISGGAVEPCLKGQVSHFLLHPASEDREFGFEWFELDYPEALGGAHGIVFDMLK
ncbi:hypothetical protein G6514_006588 [Epicoccum nigrum]|nr:hypothetical protein G6514_006588 [Epicoccum nigrum]